MKAKALLLFISFVCGPTLYSFGQVDCNASTKLVCQFPFNTQSLGVLAAGSTSLSSLAAAAAVVATPYNASIATQLTQLPIPSATVGVVTLKKKGSEVGKPFENLGPILTDRPDTVGKGHVFAGFSYQHFNFNSLDGYDLGNIPIGFNYTNGSVTSYDAVSNKVSFKLDQYVGVLTVGATKSLDMSVVVPFNTVSLDVVSSKFQGYQFNSLGSTYSTIGVSPNTSISSTGSAKGIGDVTVILKQMLVGGEGNRGAVAAGASFRFPSGDSLNYLGSGTLGGNVYGLFEYRARLAPHLKVSYQWNDVSRVVNLAGTARNRLPGGLAFDAGADVKVKRALTLAVDILGNQFVNAPSFTIGNLTLPQGTGLPAGVTSITTVTPVINTYTTVNFSGGLKVALSRHFLLYGNVLVQANNVGLRSDPVPLVGIAFKR